MKKDWRIHDVKNDAVRRELTVFFDSLQKFRNEIDRWVNEGEENNAYVHYKTMTVMALSKHSKIADKLDDQIVSEFQKEFHTIVNRVKLMDVKELLTEFQLLREMLDLAHRLKTNSSHSSIRRAEEALEKSKYLVAFGTEGVEYGNLLRKRLKMRIEQRRREWKRRERSKTEGSNDGEVLPTIGLDVLKIIFSDTPPQHGNWFNIMLTCRQFHEVGKIVFDPSKKIHGEYPIVYSAVRGQIESVKYLLKCPKVDIFVNKNEAFHEALKMNQLDVLRVLVADPRVLEKDKSSFISDLGNDVNSIEILTREFPIVPLKEYWFKACILNDSKMLKRIVNEEGQNLDLMVPLTTRCLDGLEMLLTVLFKSSDPKKCTDYETNCMARSRFMNLDFSKKVAKCIKEAKKKAKESTTAKKSWFR
eukprot:TRINITY_DN4636_c0_g1_i1.p1 TRINITY_DN4636_c0_g1~~TRINITY_DN4636_c0_g1_i1.p1  ORF type:complete len:417 (-),score=124.33 TRINITY_DN4636_c0_g1_i1:1538-2788(-)